MSFIKGKIQSLFTGHSLQDMKYHIKIRNSLREASHDVNSFEPSKYSSVVKSATITNYILKEFVVEKYKFISNIVYDKQLYASAVQSKS